MGRGELRIELRSKSRVSVAFLGAEESFEGEKDVPALPVPVESIEVGVEGVLGRDFRNIRMIGFSVGPEIKA